MPSLSKPIPSQSKGSCKKVVQSCDASSHDGQFGSSRGPPSHQQVLLAKVELLKGMEPWAKYTCLGPLHQTDHKPLQAQFGLSESATEPATWPQLPSRTQSNSFSRRQSKRSGEPSKHACATSLMEKGGTSSRAQVLECRACWLLQRAARSLPVPAVAPDAWKLGQSWCKRILLPKHPSA